MIESSLMTGAILVGAHEKYIFRLEEAGSCLGRAFQICDDILNVTGTEKELEKSTWNDSDKGKRNYVSLRNTGIKIIFRDMPASITGSPDILFSDIVFISPYRFLTLNMQHNFAFTGTPRNQTILMNAGLQITPAKKFRKSAGFLIAKPMLSPRESLIVPSLFLSD